MSGSNHIPVLLQSGIDMLAVDPHGVYFDGTLGMGGHARAILQKLGEKQTGARLIAVDKDEHILARTRETLAREFPHHALTCVSAGFETILEVARNHSVTQLHGALFDLGWGTHTLESGRGFSFQKDEPLLMTYSVPKEDTLTALDIVNTWSLETLTAIFTGWGEEKRAYRAARAIISARDIRPIKTTGELVSILESCIPKVGKVHPATRIFQALRIAVNREIEILEPAFRDTLSLLVPSGRLVVITFHSGEDRVVKHLFNRWEKDGFGEHLTRSVIVPSDIEKTTNPRARSAKLRAFQKSM